jgi:hypothetical protein
MFHSERINGGTRCILKLINTKHIHTNTNTLIRTHTYTHVCVYPSHTNIYALAQCEIYKNQYIHWSGE